MDVVSTYLNFFTESLTPLNNLNVTIMLLKHVKGIILHSILTEASFGLCLLSLPASVYPRVCVCINQELVRAITCDSFELARISKLDQNCKTPWLRSLLFWDWLILTFKAKFSLFLTDISDSFYVKRSLKGVSISRRITTIWTSLHK